MIGKVSQTKKNINLFFRSFRKVSQAKKTFINILKTQKGLSS